MCRQNCSKESQKIGLKNKFERCLSIISVLKTHFSLNVTYFRNVLTNMYSQLNSIHVLLLLFQKCNI